MQNLEVRNFEINAIGDMKLSGLVNKSGEWSQLLGIGRKFKERIDKGAFDRAIKTVKTIDLLEDHDKKSILATTDNKSLELWEDSEGLKFKATLIPTNYGIDIYQLVKANVINHMSFGFRVIKDSWDMGDDGTRLRTIQELELTEISVVRNPAYLASTVEARALKTNDKEKEKMTDKEFNKETSWNGKTIKETIEDTKNIKVNKDKLTGGDLLVPELYEIMGKSEILGKTNIKIADGNTSVTYTLIKANTGTLKEDEEGIICDEDSSSYIECMPIGIVGVTSKSQLDINSNPFFNENTIKNILDEKVRKGALRRLGVAIGKVSLIDKETTVIKSIAKLFSEYSVDYLEDNYFVCNRNDYKVLCMTEKANGEFLVEFEGNTPKINGITIEVNDSVEGLYLVNPKCIGTAVKRLLDFTEIKTTNLARVGKRQWEIATAINCCIIDENGVKGIKVS